MEMPEPTVVIPGAEPQVESPEQWKLFVGQIPRNYRQEELYPTFAAYGELEEVFIIRDQNTGISKGCCFVRYRNKESAERCIEALNDKMMLPGAVNPLQVSYATQNNGMRNGAAPNDSETKLFVGQLPPSFTEVELSRLFEPYGTVREVFIMRHRDSGMSKGAGFVRLEADANNVRRAIMDLNGKIMEETQAPLKVDVAHQKGMMMSPRRMGPGMAIPGMNGQPMQHRYPMQTPVIAYSQGGPAGWYPAQPPQMDRKLTANLPKLFVGGLTQHTTEDQLMQIFSHYGQVREVVILRYPNGQSKSSGFVKYSTEEEADVAVASLSNRYSIPGSARPLTVRYAGPTNNPPEHKLFVGHLPPNFDEAQTEQLFRAFGDVIEVHVMRDPRGQTKGSAFVKFAQRPQAEAAIQALHGSTSLNPERPLKVSFALAKNVGLPPHHSIMGQPPLLQLQQQLQGQSQMHGMPMQQPQQPGMLPRPGANGNVMGQGQAPVSAPQDHMQMQQHMSAYAYYQPIPPYFSVPPTADGSAQLPVSF